MALTLNGSANTIGGLAVGGLPDGTVDEDSLAANAVVTGKITDATIALADVNADLKQRVCKAWVNFDGSGTAAIRDSFNIASLTDNGTGQYTVNIDTDMGNSNYCAVCGGSANSAGGSKGPYVNSTDSDHMDIYGYDQSGNYQDTNRVTLAVFGDS